MSPHVNDTFEKVVVEYTRCKDRLLKLGMKEGMLARLWREERLANADRPGNR